MRVVIRPYKLGSKSAKLLQEKIKDAGIRCIRIRNDGRYRYRDSDVRINWGNSSLPSVEVGQEINPPSAVAQACNKATALTLLNEAGVKTPSFWIPEAPDDYPEGRYPLVARTLLRASSGRGCHVVDNDQERDAIRSVKLWTKYIKKTYEIRVHVWGGEVLRSVRKMRRRDQDHADSRVWNHSNGYVFVPHNHLIPQDILESGELLAKSAVQALNLDFGAVDLVYNRHYDNWYVLEVNTAVGLDNMTASIYANNIINNIL
jgi:glutathione synthase/RimK-type ligase-like ATP-grasp enzyme